MPRKAWPNPEHIITSGGIELIAVRTEPTLERMIEDLEQEEYLAVDTETTGLPGNSTAAKKSRLQVFHPANKVLGVGLANRVHRGYYIPLHLHGDAPGKQMGLLDPTDLTILNRDIATAAIKHLLSHSKLVFHNAPFDWKVIKKHLDIHIEAVAGDTLSMQALIDENLVNTGTISEKAKRRKLKWLMGYYWKQCPVCNYIEQITRDPDLPARTTCPHGCKVGTALAIMLPLGNLTIDRFGGDLATRPIMDILLYAAKDAPFTLRLFFYLKDIIDNSKDTHLGTGANIPRIMELEHAVSIPVAQMEMAGAHISTAYFGNLQRQLSTEISALDLRLKELSGIPTFRPTNNKDLAHIMWRVFQMKPARFDFNKKTREETRPVDSAQLIMVRNRLTEDEKLGPAGQFLTAMIDWKERYKIYSTYAVPIPNSANTMEDHKIHPQVRALGAKSGRGATSDPNLTNLPVSEEFDVRRGFIAPPGWVLTGRDYVSAEFRIAAAWSQCPNMLSAIESDPHRKTASVTMEIPEGEVTTDQRRCAKETNFASLFGVTAPTLRMNLEVKYGILVSLETAQGFLYGFFKTYPVFAKRYKEECDRIRRELFSVTERGRVRHLPKRPTEGMIRSAFNTVIQGCVHPNTLIWTSDGIRSVKELYTTRAKYPNRKVWDGRKFQPFQVVKRGYQKLCKVTFCDESVERVTPDHKFRVLNPKTMSEQWVQAENLTANSQILVGRHGINLPTNDTIYHGEVSYTGSSARFSLSASTKLTVELAEVLGRYVGDGSYTTASKTTCITFNHSEGEVAKFALGVINNIAPGLGRMKEIRKDHPKKSPLWHVYTCHKAWAALLDNLGMVPNVHKDKRIPKSILVSDEGTRQAFIRGLFDADGSVSTASVIFLTTISEGLARDTQFLLRSIGIFSYLYHCQPKHHSKVWRVFISSESRARYIQTIGSRNPLKKTRLAKPLTKSPKSSRMLRLSPEMSKAAAEHLGDNISNADKAHRSNMRHKRTCVGRRWMMEHLKTDCELAKVLKDFVLFTATVEAIPSGETYDLIVDSEKHAYTINGIIVHNSSSDVIKEAMVKIPLLLSKEFRALDKVDMPALFLWVHDELSARSRVEHAKVVADIMAEGMHTEAWGVPLTTGCTYSRTLSKDKAGIFTDPTDVPPLEETAGYEFLTAM